MGEIFYSCVESYEGVTCDDTEISDFCSGVYSRLGHDDCPPADADSTGNGSFRAYEPRSDKARLGDFLGKLLAPLVVAYGNEAHRVFASELPEIPDSSYDSVLCDNIVKESYFLENPQLIRYFVNGVPVAAAPRISRFI